MLMGTTKEEVERVKTRMLKNIELEMTDSQSVALDLSERFRCTNIWGLPAILQFVVEEQARHPRDLSSM